MKTIRVVAAVIEKDGKILIARRLRGNHAGKWEFPGGKYEAGESGPDALKREIMEELDCEIEVRELLCTVEHQYEDFYLIMDCFICALISDHLHLHDHSDIAWIDCEDEISEWVPADVKVIQQYRKRQSCKK